MDTLVQKDNGVQIFDPNKETLADFAYRAINDVLKNGTEEEIRECIGAFYERVNWQGEFFLTLISGSDFECKFSAEKNGIEFEIDVVEWKFKFNGRYIRNADVADLLGVPMAFVDGLSFACQHIGRCLGSKHKQQEEWIRLKVAQAEVQKKLSLLKKQERKTRDEFVKSLRRHAEKRLDQKFRNIAIEAARHEWWQKLDDVCRYHSMPSVTQPSLRRSDIQKMEPFSGIYFEWNKDQCEYVGMSGNVPHRISESHHKLEGNALMSFIQFPLDQLARAEHFYIWLLHPRKNGSPGQKFKSFVSSLKDLNNGKKESEAGTVKKPAEEMAPSDCTGR